MPINALTSNELNPCTMSSGESKPYIIDRGKFPQSSTNASSFSSFTNLIHLWRGGYRGSFWKVISCIYLSQRTSASRILIFTDLLFFATADAPIVLAKGGVYLSIKFRNYASSLEVFFIFGNKYHEIVASFDSSLIIKIDAIMVNLLIVFKTSAVT